MSRRAVLPPARRRLWPWIAVVGIALAVIWTYTLVLGRAAQDREVERRMVQAENIAGLFEQHTLRLLRYADSRVRGVRREFLRTGEVEAVEALIADSPLDDQAISHITIIDESGVPVLVSGRTIKPGTHAADRPYFQAMRATSGDPLLISRPLRGRNSGKVTLRLVRRIADETGRFRGVVFAALPVPNLSRFFADLDIDPESAFLLAGSDLLLRAHSRLEDPTRNVDLTRFPLWQALRDDPRGHFVAEDPVDGRRRHYAYRSLEDFPLLAVVGISTVCEEGRLAAFARSPEVYAAGVLTVLVLWLATAVRRKLDMSQERLAAVADAAPDTIITLDADGRIENVNAAGERTLGRETAELRGRDLGVLVPELADTALGPGAAERLRALIGHDREVTAVADAGAGFPAMLSVNEARIGSGRLFVCVLHDIRDSKAAAAALRESQERFRDFAESASDWFWEMDENLRFSYFSSRFTEVTGVPQSVLLGRTREETGIPGVDPDAWAEHLDNLHNHRKFRAFVHPRPTADGAVKWFSINGQPIFSSDGRFRGFRGTGADITPVVEAEKRMAQAREEALEASRAKSDFLASMSHELRTPMNAILGFGQLLESSPSPLVAPEHRSYVDHILTAGRHLLKLIEDVLDVARMDADQLLLIPEEVDLARLIAECGDLVATEALQRDITLELPDADGRALFVHADRTRLAQVLLNLLSNAIKYNRDGGRVTVTAADGADGMVRLTVTDTGPGISRSGQARIFEPFTRLAPRSQAADGVGIGLSITQRLVTLMGGRIGVESEPGHGACFWVELPASAVARPAAGAGPTTRADAPAPTPAGHGGPLVLYVDDDGANLALMAEFVRSRGEWQLLVAPNAELGLDLARRRVPDVILLDIQLPGVDGLEARRLLAEDRRTRDIPVVAVSAGAMPEQVERALAAGFAAYVTKPVDFERLRAVVEGALARRAVAARRPASETTS